MASATVLHMALRRMGWRRLALSCLIAAVGVGVGLALGWVLAGNGKSGCQDCAVTIAALHHSRLVHLVGGGLIGLLAGVMVAGAAVLAPG